MIFVFNIIDVESKRQPMLFNMHSGYEETVEFCSNNVSYINKARV